MKWDILDEKLDAPVTLIVGIVLAAMFVGFILGMAAAGG